MWLKLLLIPILAYASLIAVVFFAQGAVLFPAGAAAGARSIPADAERLEAVAAFGERLHGIHLRPRRPGAERLLLLAFGGNAWNAEDAAAYLAELFPEADVVAFHYRGYRPSEGRPSAAALLADAAPVHDLAVARVEPARTIAVGFSIGGGVVASLASRRSLDGLILVTPFDSLEEVAARRFRWLPARWLLRHRMSPAEDLRGVRVPVALIAAGR
ncbi:MAG: alpha/beta fold hydrolase, partial [Sphingomonadaceae bacterium]|nr:alpha/beta fold hydrolase [Sphingomonadaceae bacterium]